jgi:hypothetical protein
MPSLTLGAADTELLIQVIERLKMIATISIQDLKTSYEDLRKRVEQLGRFL